jgi:hypothetical protein
MLPKVRIVGNSGKGLENASYGGLVLRTRLNKAKTKTDETKPTLQEAFQQRGTIQNH